MNEHQVVVVFDVTADSLIEAGQAVADHLATASSTGAPFGHIESCWMPEEPLRSEVDGNDNSRGWLVFECPTCGGGGELTECRSPGFCSHVDDRSWPCTECMGTGTTRTRTAS